MAIALLALPEGGYSLEFEPSDLPRVRAAINERYGQPRQRDYPASSSLRFGGCDFVFQDEWDAPCLISSSSEGGDILKALHSALQN
jgi:hypothetical protein